MGWMKSAGNETKTDSLHADVFALLGLTTVILSRATMPVSSSRIFGSKAAVVSVLPIKLPAWNPFSRCSGVAGVTWKHQKATPDPKRLAERN
jgi:hypothetical protein